LKTDTSQGCHMRLAQTEGEVRKKRGSQYPPRIHKFGIKMIQEICWVST